MIKGATVPPLSSLYPINCRINHRTGNSRQSGCMRDTSRKCIPPCRSTRTGWMSLSSNCLAPVSLPHNSPSGLQSPSCQKTNIGDHRPHGRSRCVNRECLDGIYEHPPRSHTNGWYLPHMLSMHRPEAYARLCGLMGVFYLLPTQRVG